MATKKKSAPNDIAQNRKARFDYLIEEEFEAGVSLQGWEVKSLRDGRAQLTESYVVILHGELFLIGAHFSPLRSASSHVNPDPVRSRKLLLHKQRAGYTIVPLGLYWKRGKVKVKIALAKGKRQYDKRRTLKEREWARDRQRLLKSR